MKTRVAIVGLGGALGSLDFVLDDCMFAFARDPHLASLSAVSPEYFNRLATVLVANLLACPARSGAGWKRQVL
jgi:hypothetical protein